MRIRWPQFNSAHAIALLALFVSLGGTVYAASTINGKTIKKASIPGNRLKPNAVTEAQVNEASLRIVPSAQRASEAARAEVADSAKLADSAKQADSANLAERAKQADKALEAAKAGEAAKATEALTAVNATQAARATQADNATFAQRAGDADTIKGLGPGSLQERCKSGSVRGMAFIDPTNPPFIKKFFNCAGTPENGFIDLDGIGVFGTAEWDLTFPGVTEGFATASAAGLNSAVSVTPFGGPTFRVKIFSTRTAERLPNEPFTVVVF